VAKVVISCPVPKDLATPLLIAATVPWSLHHLPVYIDETARGVEILRSYVRIRATLCTFCAAMCKEWTGNVLLLLVALRHINHTSPFKLRTV